MGGIVTYASGVKFVQVERHEDDRGRAHEFVSEIPLLRSLTVLSWHRVIRGMHFQDWRVAPLTKVVTVLEGRIQDFVYDLRPDGDGAYGFALKGGAAETDEQQYIIIPPWCAHGYAVMSAYAVVQYFFDAPRDVDAERVIHYKSLPIAWPAFQRGPTLSEKDARAPHVSEVLAEMRSALPA